MLNAINPVHTSRPSEPRASAGGGFLAALDRVLADPGLLGAALGRTEAQSVPGSAPMQRGEPAGIARRDDDPNRPPRWPEFTSAALAVAELKSTDDPSPSAAVQNAQAVAEADRSGEPEQRPTPRASDRRSPAGSSPIGAAPMRTTTEGQSPAPGPNANPGHLSPPGVARAPDPGAGSTSGGPRSVSPVKSAVPGDPSVAVTVRTMPAAAARPVTLSGVPGAVPAGSRPPIRDAGAASAARPGSEARAGRPFQLESDPFAAQVGKGLAALLARDGGSVTLRLDPEALGDLTVRLSVSSGRVEATLEAATDRARQLLESSLPTLRSALEAHGLIVDRLAVRTAEQPPPDRQDAEGPGVGPDPDGTGGRAGEDATGAEHPGTGGSARANPFAAGLREPVDHQPEAIVAPEGVGVGAGGVPTRLRLDTLA